MLSTEIPLYRVLGNEVTGFQVPDCPSVFSSLLFDSSPQLLTSLSFRVNRRRRRIEESGVLEISRFVRRFTPHSLEMTEK